MAMGIRDTMLSALEDLFAKIGEDAIYTPTGGTQVACKVMIEIGVQLQPAGLDAQVTQTGTVIQALLSAKAGVGIGTSVPARGNTFTWDSTVYKVSSVLENDGFSVRLAVV
jgi:hypothetical protein